MPKINIKIDSEVFKVTGHPLVNILLSGGISAEHFARLLTPRDPFIILGDTLYALTPAEFYSLHSSMVYRQLSKTAFQYLVDHAEELSLPQDEKNYILNVKDKLPGCPSCTYNKYRNKVSEIIHKYSIHLPKTLLDNESPELPYSSAKYPSTRGDIVSKVGTRIISLYHAIPVNRKSCVDCVEKHISQAHILGRESLMGYPEHLALACGHLEEAIAELPDTAADLFSTLQFCLAKTRHEKRPFIPVSLLLPMLELLRMQDTEQITTDTSKIPDIPEVMEMDCDEAVEKELLSLSPQQRNILLSRLALADAQAVDTNNKNYKALWEGLMACAAEDIAEVAPRAANVLRNRRLMFACAPELIVDAGYAVSDFSAVLKR